MAGFSPSKEQLGVQKNPKMKVGYPWLSPKMMQKMLPFFEIERMMIKKKP
jgi:hypothetical protein